ncbi:hypothetical protein [Jatrophihabitans fulvus]
MLTMLLLMLTAVFAVVAAEFVRSTCRRQLMTPAVVQRPSDAVPQTAR